jgi:NhaP-type Na+/H+ or K+/H+ antiporter
MRSVAGLMMGAFAGYIVWTLVRALRDRIIFSDGIGYDLDEQPMKFASTAAMHGVGALLFAWLAAGGIANVFRLVLPH